MLDWEDSGGGDAIKRIQRVRKPSVFELSFKVKPHRSLGRQVLPRL